MIQPLDQSIIELLQASADDEATLGFPVNDRTFGFHAQQAIEKLFKALIGGRGERYKFTHDLEDLRLQLEALGEQLPFAASVLHELSNYAGVWRYQEPDDISPDRRVELKQVVGDLRLYLLGRLVVLRPGVDWMNLR